jgi:hypothetical protein
MSIPRIVQRRESGHEADASRAPLPTGGGAALDAGVRERFEPLFGMDLSSVRVSEGSEAVNWGAMACASGEELFFSPGTYRPNTSQGDELIAHEVAHVAQQRAGRVSHPQGKDGINADAGLEAEADAAAARVMRGEPAGIAGGAVRAAPGPIQRRTYKALSDTQQYQVDAVADDIVRTKSEAFEDRLGQVAAGHATANLAANQMLGALAAAQPAHAVVINAQVGNLAPAKATFLANVVVGMAPGPQTTAARNETWQTSSAFGGQQNVPVVAGGRVSEDTNYATGARASGAIVRGGGSTSAATLFGAANALGVSIPNTKVLAYGWLVPPRAHSFHEIMLAAQDAGQAYHPGPQGYRDIAPLTQDDVGRHFPDFFREPEMLIQYAHYLFPDPGGGAAAERAAAQNHFPADVLARLQQILPGFSGKRADADLQPLLNAGIARNLIEQLDDAAFAALVAFVNGNTIAGVASWAAMTGHATYTAVSNAAGASTAQLIFGHLYHAAHAGDATADRLADAHSTLTGGAARAVPVNFNLAQHAGTNAGYNANVIAYGNNDRDVNMQATAQATQNAGLTPDAASSVRDYTGNGFGDWHRAMGASGAETPAQAFARLGGPGSTALLNKIHAANSALDQLPVYDGPVFRGTGGAALANPAARANALAAFTVGNVVTPESHMGSGFLSTAKTIGDSFIAAADYAIVIDGVQTGRDIQLLSVNAHEREVLFEPNARFVVQRVEDTLGPAPIGMGPHVYTTGNLWIYLKEIGTAKSAPERNTRDQAFQQAYLRERDGRRLVDRGMYDEAQLAYQTEARPLAEPRNRFEHQGALGALAANQRLPSTQADDWAAAEQYMRGEVGHPLTANNFQQMHLHAAAHLNAHAGQFRANGDEVIALGGLDVQGLPAGGGPFSALTDAEFDEGSRNSAVRFGQPTPVPNHVPMPAHLVGKTWLVQIAYTLGAEVAASLQSFLTWYNQRFAVVQAIGDANRRAAQAKKFAANAQKKFVSIHPFHDGNGRASRLVMDHIMLSFGLAPAILDDTNADIFTADPQWEQAVATGWQTTENLYAEYNG